MLSKRRLYAALVLASCASSAWAGDDAETIRVRFSPDGGVVAALSRGVHDGSGHAFAELTVLSTVDGRLLLHKKVETQRAVGQLVEATPVADALWQKHAAALAQLGIPPTRAADSVPRFTAPVPKTVPIDPLGPGIGGTEQYAVRYSDRAAPLFLKVTPGIKRCSLETPAPEASYTLSVAGNTVSQGQRPCAMDYGVRRIDVRGNWALLTVAAFTPGFEGPNLELFYVVTALP